MRHSNQRHRGAKQFSDKTIVYMIIGCSAALLLLIGVFAARQMRPENALAEQQQPDTAAEQVAPRENIPSNTQESQVAAVSETPAPTVTPTTEPTKEPPPPLFATEPLCFGGEADYAYNDERLSIYIKKYQESDMTYFVCDIQTADTGALRAALSGDKANGVLEYTSDIAERNDAVLAINGDDYGAHNNGIIIRNGELIRARKTTRHMLVLNQDGTMYTVTERGDVPKELGEQLVSEHVRQTWEFGPELIRDGLTVDFQDSFELISQKENTLEPRTGIGQIDANHYVIIVVDGRNNGYSVGASLFTLQKLFLRTGVQTAFNLDGGGSTTLYFAGEVLNQPSGGKERSVSDILYF